MTNNNCDLNANVTYRYHNSNVAILVCFKKKKWTMSVTAISSVQKQYQTFGKTIFSTGGNTAQHIEFLKPEM